jgi:uncharacterized protein (TIGR03435 family)
MNAALGRISNRLWSNLIDEVRVPKLASRLDEPRAPIRRRSGWGVAAAIAAAIAIAVLVPARVIRSAPAILEDSAGSRRIQYGEIVSPRGGEGGTLRLTNGSSVEMRSKTELSVERVDDSLRIHIHNGDVIVNSAEPLLVETRDISASGKVFLVNAKEEGSRVAVIDGEARIQQGTAGRTLLPGEQVATSREMESLPMKEGMGWSRKAEVQLAQLQQPATTPTTTSRRETFEVVSIRLAHQGTAPGARGGGGNNVGPTGCAADPPEVNPRRFALADTNVWSLLTIAYSGNPFPQGCADLTALNLISGGPSWIRSDKWDIQATFPEGFPAYTQQQLKRGEATRFRTMVLTMLEDRFQLAVRREMKEVAAFALTAEAGAPKFIVPSVYPGGLDDPDFKKYVWDSRAPGASPSEIGIIAKDASMADVTAQLARAMGRPVIDRTGVTGSVNFILNYDPRLGPTSKVPSPGAQNLGQPFAKGLEQVGFKLSDTKTTVETWVIERIEKPSEN